VQFVTLSGPGNGPDSVWIERSSDGGLSFDQPTLVAGANSFQTTLAVDQKNGRLFAAWLQSNPAAPTATCASPKPVFPSCSPIRTTKAAAGRPRPRSATRPDVRIGAPALAVDSRGNPSILYFDYGSDRVDWEDLMGTYDAKFSLIVVHSSDRCVTFSPGRVVDADIVPPHRFPSTFPTARVLQSDPTGAWSPRGRTPAVVNPTSCPAAPTDGGATWSNPVRFNGDSAVTGSARTTRQGALAAGGRIDVVYYDRILDHRGTTADVFLSSSTNGGHSFAHGPAGQLRVLESLRRTPGFPL